jgi:hypothetical protein
MNNLGGMVFIVAGIAMGYWVLTGRAKNFLYALTTGQQYSTGSGDPQHGYTLPGGGGGFGKPYPGDTVQEASNASNAVFNDNYPMTTVPLHAPPSYWDMIA